MTIPIILLLTIMGLAVVFFSLEWVSADVVGLAVLLALIFTGLLTPVQAFAGFGSETVIFILGLLIITAALQRTGVVEMVGRAVVRQTGHDPQRMLLIITIGAAVMSAFMSNTASTAFFLPIVIGLAHRAKLNPARLLMPLAFAAILASSVTLVSTSTNIVVSGLMAQYNLPTLGMFELTPVGLPIAIIGLGYMLLIGHRLIPVRGEDDELTEAFGLRPYLSEIVILPDSPLAGKTLAESGLGRDLDLTVLRLERGDASFLAPKADLVLLEGDELLVEGGREQIIKIKATSGVDIKADVEYTIPDLQTKDMCLVEVIVPPRSPFIGRTIMRLGFRDRYGMQVLAINRHGETIRNKISQVVLRLGDVLLVQGRRRTIANLERDRSLQVLGLVDDTQLPQFKRAPIAVAIFITVLVAAAIDLLPLSVAMLLGALLMFVTRCITPEEAYREVEWKSLILIGSMLALGAAMEASGAASYLAMQIVQALGTENPLWLLSAFFGLSVLLTQPMSNQAAAVVVIPVAIQAALQLGLNPRTFAVMIAVAASTSYITPLEPACLMVFGPGRYRFFDFVRVGAPLTVIVYLLAIFLVPAIWPF